MTIDIAIPIPEHHHPVELAAIQRLRDDTDGLTTLYFEKNRKEGITFIARDAAKRVFPEYNADPTHHNRYVDASASALADGIRRYLLSVPADKERKRIMLVTGAPASGKTVAASTLRLPTTEMVHETILTSTEKARRVLQESLEAGRSIKINLFYTDDPRINVRRMIARARRIGRTVPLAYMAKAYSEVPQIVHSMCEEFGGRIDLLIANNSRTTDDVEFHRDIVSVVATTARYTIEECLKVMDHELALIHSQEEIPDGILKEAHLRQVC